MSFITMSCIASCRSQSVHMLCAASMANRKPGNLFAYLSADWTIQD